MSEEKKTKQIKNDLGTFEGFNHRTQSAIYPNLTAQEVVDWDHDGEGEAEFWPHGDNSGVMQLFKGQDNVSGCTLLALDELLTQLDYCQYEQYARIYYALDIAGCDLHELAASDIKEQAQDIEIFIADNDHMSLIEEAAYYVLERYYPDEYEMIEKGHIPGLKFDADEFFYDSWSTTELRIFDTNILILGSC